MVLAAGSVQEVLKNGTLLTVVVWCGRGSGCLLPAGYEKRHIFQLKMREKTPILVKNERTGVNERKKET